LSSNIVFCAQVVLLNMVSMISFSLSLLATLANMLLVEAGGPYVTTCHSDSECGTVCGHTDSNSVSFNEGTWGTKCWCQDGSDNNLKFACHVWNGLDAWLCRDGKPPHCSTACGQQVCIGKDNKYTNAVMNSACPQHHPNNVEQCCAHKSPAYCTCLFQWTADLNAAPYRNIGGNNGYASGAWWGACGSVLHGLKISIDTERANRLVQPFLRNGTWCEANGALPTYKRKPSWEECQLNQRSACGNGCIWCSAGKEAGVPSKCYSEDEAEVLEHVFATEMGGGQFSCDRIIAV